jgi:hypothetical protein
MNKNLSNLLVLSGILLGSATAFAQPTDPYAEEAPTATPPPAPAQPIPVPQPEPATTGALDDESPASAVPPRELAAQPRQVEQPPSSQAAASYYSHSKMKAPQLLSVPTAHLLPAAIIYSTASVDTGGSVGGSVRVGLGDVGEFGLETSPLIRMIPNPGDVAETVQPMIFATFKMGVAEERLFNGQPAVALGFRKSFNRSYEGNDIRAAAIELTASKTFGHVSLHGGGIFWDAELEEIGGDPIALHDDALGIKRKIRPFGGLEAEPIDNAQLLVDVAWVPLFRPGESRQADRVSLRPSLSWGIRYVLSDAISIESGVRVPDIAEANLLDAQIFGQFTFASDKIRRGLGLK